MGEGAQVFYGAALCCAGKNWITVRVDDGRGGEAMEKVIVIVELPSWIKA